MKRIVIATAMSLCVVSLAAIASADTLVLRDGTRIEGTVIGIAARTITFRHADGVTRRYPTNQVEALEFLSAERANPRAVRGGTLEAPAGAQLVVRTVETIDSRNVGADQIFSAIVERDVTDSSGRVIIPQRSSAQLLIRQISSGAATDRPEIALDIQSITVDGRRYLVSTRDLTQDSDIGSGKNKRTAEMIDGGSAAGGKGAAIGVAVPFPADASADAITRGNDVHVPAETVLKFTLARVVTLQPER